MSDPNSTDLTRLKKAVSHAADLSDPISVRVSPHSYFTALFLGTFFSGLLFYLELDLPAAVLLATSWFIVPMLAWRDRVSFDGRSLRRTGIVPRLWTWFNGGRRRLKVNDIEQVETQSIRALKRGGSIHYRYRTVFRGKGMYLTITSGGEEYRRMIRAILPRLADDSLDVRSLELRDFLNDPKDVLAKVDTSQIPSAEALEGTVRKMFATRSERLLHTATPDIKKADELRRLANELRVSGYLTQALELFRRAINIGGANGRLWFEFGRCLHAFASSRKDERLTRKALVALRLSERRLAEDGDMLSRLAEFYFSLGEWRRAGIVFGRVVDRVGENFRSARGLAEIALRDGKIAYVIHHFATANRVAGTPSLRRWTRGEADYFSHLNSDDEYMEMEIARVNLLDTLERSKRTALNVAFLAFPAIAIGAIFDDELVTNIGWAVSTISLVIWAGLIVTANMLARRIPYDMMPEDS